MTDERQQKQGERCETCEHYRPKRCLRFPMGGYPLRDHWCREYQKRIGPMTEAERVLAELVLLIAKAETECDWAGIKVICAALLPKPEPDRLTLAARDVVALTAPSPVTSAKINGVEISIVPAIRAIIAREVAAAEPSDAGINRMIRHIKTDAWTHDELREALKGKLSATPATSLPNESKGLGEGMAPTPATPYTTTSIARAALKGEGA